MAYKPEDFYVGQRVRIREWDDMKEEFGVKASGNISCAFSFTEDMEYLCGMETTIEAISDADYKGRTQVALWEWPDGVSTPTWLFSTDMIEPAEDVAGIEFDNKAFAAMLGI